MISRWSKVTRRLFALRHLRNPGDAFLFFRIAVFATAVPALLRLNLTKLEIMLGSNVAPSTTDSTKVAKIVKYVDSLLRLGKPLVRPGCLTRGLTLYYFLRRAGLHVSLHFGLGHYRDEIVGHCWLVKDGQPFLEATDPRPRFTEMYGFSAEARPLEPFGQQEGGTAQADGTN